MLTDPQRFSQLRWLNTAVGVFTILVGCVLIGCGIVGVESSPRVWMLAAGAFVLFIAIMLMALMTLVIKVETSAARYLTELRRVKEAVQQALPTLDAIADNTRISDAAKSLTHRDREMELVRAAIKDDIQAGRWDLGISLIGEVERRGFKEEAEAIRGELEDARGQAIQAKLGKAIEVIEAHFAAHDWERAAAEIDRLTCALPRNAQVAKLSDRMAQCKEHHKEELKLAWNEAVRRSDTDRAIDVLRGLDQYLSSAEVHELQSSARNVFKDKLLQLGVQFRFAVTEKRWQDALDAGLELVNGFPNARMANEVREALDVLRQRVHQGGVASAEPAESQH